MECELELNLNDGLRNEEKYSEENLQDDFHNPMMQMIEEEER